MSISAPPLTWSPLQSNVNAARLGPDRISTSRAAQAPPVRLSRPLPRNAAPLRSPSTDAITTLRSSLRTATSIRPDSAPDSDSRKSFGSRRSRSTVRSAASCGSRSILPRTMARPSFRSSVACAMSIAASVPPNCALTLAGGSCWNEQRGVAMAVEMLERAGYGYREIGNRDLSVRPFGHGDRQIEQRVHLSQQTDPAARVGVKRCVDVRVYIDASQRLCQHEAARRRRLGHAPRQIGADREILGRRQRHAAGELDRSGLQCGVVQRIHRAVVRQSTGKCRRVLRGQLVGGEPVDFQRADVERNRRRGNDPLEGRALRRFAGRRDADRSCREPIEHQRAAEAGHGPCGNDLESVDVDRRVLEPYSQGLDMNTAQRIAVDTRRFDRHAGRRDRTFDQPTRSRSAVKHTRCDRDRPQSR